MLTYSYLNSLTATKVNIRQFTPICSYKSLGSLNADRICRWIAKFKHRQIWWMFLQIAFERCIKPMLPIVLSTSLKERDLSWVTLGCWRKSLIGICMPSLPVSSSQGLSAQGCPNWPRRVCLFRPKRCCFQLCYSIFTKVHMANAESAWNAYIFSSLVPDSPKAYKSGQSYLVRVFHLWCRDFKYTALKNEYKLRDFW